MLAPAKMPEEKEGADSAAIKCIGRLPLSRSGFFAPCAQKLAPAMGFYAGAGFLAALTMTTEPMISAAATMMRRLSGSWARK